MESEVRAELRPETLAAVAALRTALPGVQSRRGADDVRAKAPGDLVTATDVLTQQLIFDSLHAAAPEVGFVGEEGASSAPSNARRYWLVDPICGTTNYAFGIPLWAINIALVEDGQLTCAAVADGSNGEILVAERGTGAWRLGSEDRLRANAASRLLSIDPHSRGDPTIARFSVRFAQAAVADARWDTRVLSTTLALPWIAAGRLAGAVYASLGNSVHLGAGLLLATESGATVTDGDGAPWTLDSPVYVVGADAAFHAEILSLVASIR